MRKREVTITPEMATPAFHEGRRCGAVFRPSEKAREWLIGEAPKLTKVLIETSPKYVAKQDRWIPMGER